MRKVIALDMDQVIADLLSEWVERVNFFEGENVNVNDIKCWDIYKYFKCGKKVYDYLTHHVFRNLPVIENSQEVVKKLMDKYDVYVVSTATNNADSLRAKVEWLKEYFNFIPMTNVVLCGDKSIIKADIMIDDGVHNLETFDGMKILFDAPHNRNDNRFTRAIDWLEIEKLLLK